MSAPVEFQPHVCDDTCRPAVSAPAKVAGTAAGVAILVGLAGLVATVRVAYVAGKVAGWCASPGWPL